MMKHNWPGTAWASLLTSLLVLTPLAASAYQIGEDTPPPSAASSDATSASSAANSGPIRLARFSYVKGNVTWRPGDGADWSPASVNLPIRQGAQVWVTDGGRAEVQFDDGSLLRLGNGAVATLQTLYSDSSGEFTEIQMNEGLSTLVLRPSASIYQVDTPLASIKSEGPSKVRIGVDNSVEVAVRSGRATVEGDGGKTTLDEGGYLDLPDASAPYTVGSLPDPDRWDRWNDDRDSEIADADSDHRLPSDIALVAGNLDNYGAWHDDPHYGSVWCPAVSDPDWRPYQHGHWVWVEPFGWTWVSSESWGWAPYHYGTWVNESYGWAWVPGPATQYWCPAVVHFSEYNGSVAWAPLAPVEVHYPPSLFIGYHRGNWALSFSIGGAAVYYPHNSVYCEPRPFNNVIVNRTTYINNVTNIYNNNSTNIYHRGNYNTNVLQNTTVNRNVYLRTAAFVPINARNANGVTTASLAGFGGRGDYVGQPRGGSSFFVHGRAIGAPLRGGSPVAGPIAVRPTAMALTPSRSFLPQSHPAASVFQRPLFRSALPTRVARVAPALPRSESPAFTAPRPTGLRQNTTGFHPTQPQTPGLPGRISRRPVGINNAVIGSPATPGNRAQQAARAARESLGQPSVPGGSRVDHVRNEPQSIRTQNSGTAPDRPFRPATPRSENNVPRSENNVPRSENNVPRSENNVPRSENNVPRSENNVPRSENNVPRSEDTAPREQSRPAPATSAPRTYRYREEPSTESRSPTPRSEGRPAPARTQGGSGDRSRSARPAPAGDGNRGGDHRGQ